MLEEAISAVDMSQQVSHAYCITMEREHDGRFIADAEALPGVMTYGDTQMEAAMNIFVLIFRVMADKIEHREVNGIIDTISFVFRYKHKVNPDLYVYTTHLRDDLL